MHWAHVFFLRGTSALGTHLRLVPRLKMCGAVPVLLLYAFISWTGTALLLSLTEDEDPYPVLGKRIKCERDGVVIRKLKGRQLSAHEPQVVN